jgi:hypothetical protein
MQMEAKYLGHKLWGSLEWYHAWKILSITHNNKKQLQMHSSKQNGMQRQKHFVATWSVWYTNHWSCWRKCGHPWFQARRTEEGKGFAVIVSMHVGIVLYFYPICRCKHNKDCDSYGDFLVSQMYKNSLKPQELGIIEVILHLLNFSMRLLA